MPDEPDPNPHEAPAHDDESGTEAIGTYELLDPDPETVPGALPIDARPMVARKGPHRRLRPAGASLDRQRLCPKCGYDMRGLVHDTCPECGTEYVGHEIEDDPFAAAESFWQWFIPLRWIPICTLPMLLIWAPLAWLAISFGDVLGYALSGMVGVVSALGLASFASVQAYSEERESEAIALAAAVFFVTAGINFGALKVLMF